MISVCVGRVKFLHCSYRLYSPSPFPVGTYSYCFPDLGFWGGQGSAPQTQGFSAHLYLEQWLLITQEDLPPLGDGGGSVEVDQLIEGVELLFPQEVLP